MANSNSASDILKGALKKAGEATDGSSSYHELALRLLNNSYKAILAGSSAFSADVGEPWPWARERHPRSIVLKPPFQDGSVALTNGSASGTFSVAPSALLGSLEGRVLKMDGRADYFRISQHTAGSTAFQIDVPYTDLTGGAINFKAIPLVYELGSGILRLVEPMRVYQIQSYAEDRDGQIYGIDINTLRREFPMNLMRAEVPIRFATVYRDTENQTSWQVQFASYVLNDTKVDLDVIAVPDDLLDSDQSFPCIPIEHRPVLESATAHFLCVEKNDSNADYFFKVTQAMILSMQGAQNKEIQQVSRQRGQLVPRADLANRKRGLFRGRY